MSGAVGGVQLSSYEEALIRDAGVVSDRDRNLAEAIRNLRWPE